MVRPEGFEPPTF